MPRRQYGPLVSKPLKVAVLISGRGSNLQALIDHFGPVITGSPVRIVKVISNRPEAQGIERAKKAGIPTAIIDHKAFPDRIAFDATLDRAIRDAGAELIVLAGFMRLLTEGFVAAWRNRMVNIHPALLPSFRGVDTHRRALKRGVKLHGATVHFVRHETDTGPIIAQAAVAVLADDTPDTLGARVLAAEHKLFPLALRLIAEGRVRVDGERAVVDGKTEPAMLFSPAL
jgi:phosphoribosylglycinamide formyltransferase-1